MTDDERALLLLMAHYVQNMPEYIRQQGEINGLIERIGGPSKDGLTFPDGCYTPQCRTCQSRYGGDVRCPTLCKKLLGRSALGIP